MARVSVRRPIPAMVFILALSLLTALVWYRVLHRSNAEGTGQRSSSRSCTTQTVAAVLPKPQQVRMTVLNSTDTAGLAGRFRTLFAQRGFAVASIGNDPNAVAGVAEIRYGSRGLAAARLVQIYLPGSVLVASPSTTTAVVTVSLGAKHPAALATPAAVSRAATSPARPVPTCK